MPYALDGQDKIYYEVHGEGVPLVLVIGLGGSSLAWRFQVDFFKSQYQVITIDNLGAGLSDKPDRPYSMENFASNLHAVFEKEKIVAAFVLGLSMGGLIVQEFYHRYPERVKALILGCTGVGAGDPDFFWPTLSVTSILNLREENYDPIDYHRSKARIFYHPDYIESHPHFIEKLVEFSKTQNQPSYAYRRQLEACVLKKGEYNSPRLKNITVPTLVYHGEDDRIWPIENARYLASHIPNATLVIMKNAAHMFFLEKKTEFNEVVWNFLQSLDKA
jgi:pimeloyl-ACP methyl ester carboxylesterase